MRFIIAYKLKRKNARRKVYAKLECTDQYDAVKQFESYCKMRMNAPDEKPRQWELLTGDWKHITYFEGKRENNKDWCSDEGFCNNWRVITGEDFYCGDFEVKENKK